MPKPILLKQAMDKETLLSCKGFDPKFINGTSTLSLSRILPKHFKDELPLVEGAKDKILRYTSLSVLYHSSRMLPIVAAYNIDGAKHKSPIRRTYFRLDPRIDKAIQLSHAFYDLKKDYTEFEIGHMAANHELSWGAQFQTQAYQTFHFPNSAPQAENLNSGVWKSLEAYIVKEASSASNKKICVFTGPILRNTDPFYVHKPDFKVPLLFFKVIVFEHEKKLYSTAFIMSHEEKLRKDKLLLPVISPRRAVSTATELAFQDFPYKKVYQVNVSEVERLSSLSFSWKGVKSITLDMDKNEVKPISVKTTNTQRTNRIYSLQAKQRISTLYLPF